MLKYKTKKTLKEKPFLADFPIFLFLEFMGPNAFFPFFNHPGFMTHINI